MQNLWFKCAVALVGGIAFATSVWIAYGLIAHTPEPKQEYKPPVEWQELFDGKKLKVTNSSIVVEAGALVENCLIIYMGDGPAIEVQEKAWSDTDLLLTIVTPNGVRKLITTR